MQLCASEENTYGVCRIVCVFCVMVVVVKEDKRLLAVVPV